jgi:hypothetical protein
MWWHFWAIILSILFLSIAMLWCVVMCAMRCFYPQGTRGPKVRTFLPGTVKDLSGRPASEPDRYIMKNGELSWRDAEAPPPPREVYKA